MLIEATDLTKEFPRARAGGRLFTAVHPLDLTLDEGQLTVITGHSGSGKSTLLNMLAGMLPPTGGTVCLGGIDLYAMREEECARLRNERIGFIPQGHAALRSLTVLENVLLPSVLYGAGRPPRERAEELLSAVGLSELADARPNELSGGELRRVGVARALLMSPAVVLADEPTAGLDAESAAGVLRLLREAADPGATVLIVTHEPEALSYADRTFAMDGGHLSGGSS